MVLQNFYVLIVRKKVIPLNSPLKKRDALKIIIEKDLDNNEFNWKLVQVDIVTSEEKTLVYGEESTMDKAFKEAKYHWFART